jgi:hypothetical protein
VIEEGMRNDTAIPLSRPEIDALTDALADTAAHLDAATQSLGRNPG